MNSAKLPAIILAVIRKLIRAVNKLFSFLPGPMNRNIHNRIKTIFNRSWYLQNYPDIVATGIEPLRHYLDIGWKEGRSPSPLFDSTWYLTQNPDVAEAGIEPLKHYLIHGWKEGRSPSSLFDSTWYLDQNPDVAEAGIEPLTHFMNFGRYEGRVPVPTTKSSETLSAIPQRFQRPPLDTGRRMFSSPLIIAGFHRSGTSLTANLFHDAGMHLGNKLLGAMYSNIYGHYEDEEVVDFHDRVLSANGINWQIAEYFPPIFDKKHWRWLIDYGIQKSNYSAWGVKDPRICLFLPQWSKVFPSMSIIYVYRPCVQCVHSIKKRAARDLTEGRAININKRFWTQPDLAIRMYLFYTHTALDFLERFPGRWTIVKLSDLIEGRDLISEVRDNWGYPLHNWSIRDIYDRTALTETGPNELVIDKTLLDEIKSVEDRLNILSQRKISYHSEKRLPFSNYRRI